MSLTLIENGTIYTPEKSNCESVLLAHERILHLGSMDARQLHRTHSEVNVIDATDCLVVPAFIDPHAHLVGAGGEDGFDSRMPEVRFEDIALAGIATVVGLLGTDTTTRNLRCLHAKCAQLSDEGLTTFMHTGGFELPPKTLLGTIMEDLVLIDKVIGAGEIALSDDRWLDPEPRDLALVIKNTVLGGKMSRKAGVVHFHMGGGDRRLAMLHQMIDDFGIEPESLYPTHITRSDELLRDAVKFAALGAFVDTDTVDAKLGCDLLRYKELGGDMSRLTVSSDAHTPSGSPTRMYEQFVSAVKHHGLDITEVLPLFTQNTARALHLSTKGVLENGCDADVLILDAETLAVKHLFASGRHIVENGALREESRQQQQLEAARQ